MLYDWTSTAALGVVRDIQPKEPLTLTGEGLWVCLISSGRCTASLTDASPSPAGSALILPPQSAAAGHLVLSRGDLVMPRFRQNAELPQLLIKVLHVFGNARTDRSEIVILKLLALGRL